jgi:hypothetical protein
MIFGAFFFVGQAVFFLFVFSVSCRPSVEVSIGVFFYLVPIYWNQFFVNQLFFMVTKFMEQCPFEKLVLSRLVSFSAFFFMETENLLLCIRASFSPYYPKLKEPISRHLILFL